MSTGTLPHGWTINSRLMACWTFEDGSTIEVAPPAYRLVNHDGVVIEESSDFQPGMGLRGWAAVLEEFVGFLLHYADGCDHGDECPFQPGWHEWCAAHEQELQNLRDTLDPDDEELPTVPETGGTVQEYLTDKGEWVRCTVLTENPDGTHSVEFASLPGLREYSYEVSRDRIRYS